MATSMDVKDFTLGTAVTIKLTDLGSAIHAAWNITQGSVASGVADADNPIKIGAKAKSALSGLTLVAADQRVNSHADLDGALVIRQNGCLGDGVSGRATDSAGAATACIAAQAAGIKTYLTDVTIANSSSTAVTVDIKDGTTIKWTFPVPANSGVTHRFATPIAGTAATAWNFQSSAAVSALYVSMAGFKSKV